MVSVSVGHVRVLTDKIVTDVNLSAFSAKDLSLSLRILNNGLLSVPTLKCSIKQVTSKTILSSLNWTYSNQRGFNYVKDPYNCSH